MIRSAFIFTILLLMFMPAAVMAEENTQLGDNPETAESAVDFVVARVSGDPITEKQVLTVINELAKRENLTIEQSRQRNSMFFDRAVESLVTTSLLKARMNEKNISVDDAVIEEHLRQTAQRFPSQEAFHKALADQGLTESSLRNSIIETIRMQNVIDETSSKATQVTETDIEKFYNDNPDKFTVPDRVRLAHILLQIPAGATAAQKEEIRKKLESVRVDIVAEIITFNDAAAKYSQDEKTAGNGGDMGLTSRDKMPKAFGDVVFNTKPGMVSQAMESQAGYHILKVLELIPAGSATLEEARASIKQYLEENSKQFARQKFVEELKSKATIEYFMTSEEFDKRNQ